MLEEELFRILDVASADIKNPLTSQIIGLTILINF